MSSDFSQWPVDTVSAAIMSDPAQPPQLYGDPQHIFELASVTKLLAAYGFLIAYEEGIFELDEEIFPNNITARHLLSHASGVGFSASDSAKPPLTRRIYSSYGFEMLAQKVQAEAEMSFATYLDEAIFQPLGMTATSLWGSAGHEARSCVRDLLAFMQELTHPQLLASETLKQAWTVQYPQLDGIVPGYGMHKPCPWGLGFEIHGEKSPHWLGRSMPADIVGHFGQSGTFMWVHPRSGKGAVVLTDRPFGPWAKDLWAVANEEIFKA
ncbi:serine hydrolase domain-containing protein [Corynebacterium sp. ES2775-CONJ]|uniref:serine hydrolase domain-containing protein n=1 Tax=Corynebacterium sp. ES2775-CONJ TaxID=2974029 RepID=UPI0037C05B5C